MFYATINTDIAIEKYGFPHSSCHIIRKISRTTIRMMSYSGDKIAGSYLRRMDGRNSADVLKQNYGVWGLAGSKAHQII